MVESQEIKASYNEEPRDLAGTKSQGKDVNKSNDKDSTQARSRARYERGLELYRQGKVSINPSGHGLFNVNGFLADVEKVKCTCPDYLHRKETCKHYFAAVLFQKNGCKVIAESKVSRKEKPNSDFRPNQNVDRGQEDNATGKAKPTANFKFYDKQAVITRLSVQFLRLLISCH